LVVAVAAAVVELMSHDLNLVMLLPQVLFDVENDYHQTMNLDDNHK
jgi:hypothetical protein